LKVANFPKVGNLLSAEWAAADENGEHPQAPGGLTFLGLVKLLRCFCDGGTLCGVVPEYEAAGPVTRASSVVGAAFCRPAAGAGGRNCAASGGGLCAQQAHRVRNPERQDRNLSFDVCS